jgi:nitroreductase
MEEHPFIEALRWRYATQVFDPARIVAAEHLAILEDAVHLTPSGFGLNPYRLFRVEKVELREQILGACWNQRQVVDASHLYVFAAMKTLPEDFVKSFVRRVAEVREQPLESLEKLQGGILKFAGRPEDYLTDWASKQSFIALGSLLAAAALLRVDACPMEGFNPKAVNDILGLPELGLTATLLCPVGYRAETDKYAHLAKVRFPLDRVVHHLD